MRDHAHLPPGGVRLYRLVKGPQPTREDFLSDRARSKPVRYHDPELLERRGGFSAWRSEKSVRELARRYPGLGTHIVEVEVPPGAALWPFRDNPDHVTVFGDADVLVRCVTRITPLE